MNFQGLERIENADFYLDRAFKGAKETGEKFFPRTSGEPIIRARRTEQEKIKTFNSVIDEKLSRILKNFPSLDGMPEFYQELVRKTLDYDRMKKSLGSINWVISQVKSLSRDYERRARFCKTQPELNKFMKGYYGRVSSVVKQINSNLIVLEESRKVMKEYPSLKTELFTVTITGFPNIGKSTLLSKITPAKPEIKNYSFTTKGLNQGYANYGIRRVQFVDTPGVLNRDKKNSIEEQAYLVLKYLSNLIIYVIDLTEPYPLKKQEELWKGLKEYDKPMIVYLSKTDILPAALVAKAKKKYAAVITLDALNKKIEKVMKEYYFEN